jgi:hypothetical protein
MHQPQSKRPPHETTTPGPQQQDLIIPNSHNHVDHPPNLGLIYGLDHTADPGEDPSRDLLHEAHGSEPKRTLRVFYIIQVAIKNYLGKFNALVRGMMERITAYDL